MTVQEQLDARNKTFPAFKGSLGNPLGRSPSLAELKVLKLKLEAIGHNGGVDTLMCPTAT